jgi:histidyl-tRNA synthetase
MSKVEFQRLPGFRDFPPEDFAFRTHIFEAWRRVAVRYGFQEYDGPPLEPLALYVEKSGEEIVGQLYNFTDKGDRNVSLRPEMTPSLARILGERSRGMAKPIRWFTMPQLFRYERQQRGRLREHYQWNVDVVGEADETADVEVVAVAIDGLRELGLTASDFHARVSDRRLLSALLEASGVAEDRLMAAYAVIDKLERAGADWALERLQDDVGLTGEQSRAVLSLFESDGLAAVRDTYGDRDGVGAALERLGRYESLLTALGLGDFLTFDLRIVRGLAYYTGIVFELFDRAGEMRALCGGGRYDRLLELVGGEPLPAVGFGMGDVVLGDLLREKGLAPETGATLDMFVISIGGGQDELVRRIAAAQRAAGRSVAYALRNQNVQKQFKAAGNAGARECIVLGPDEVARGVVLVRDMASGEEREVSLDELQ